MKLEIFAKVDRYIANLLAPEDNVLLAITKSLAKAGMPQHSVSPNQGKLYTLAILCNAKNILEIGTLRGYSTIWLGRALPNNGCLISLESDPLHAEVAQKNVILANLESNLKYRSALGNH